MELDLSVGEPDIGRVRAGDPVHFTVLAYPNRTFHGVVSQVRQSPTVVSNVVTYTTVVLVDNKDAALRPGMTANSTIQVAHVDNATIVPLAAFTYQPLSGSVAPGARRGSRGQRPAGASAAAGTSASPWGATSGSSGSAVTPGARGRIFVLRGGKLVVVPVSVGLIADTQATVTPLRGTLGTTDQVVTGDNRGASSRAANKANPLAGNTAPGGGGGRGGPLGGTR
jgi:HlyD family secretion protein